MFIYMTLLCALVVITYLIQFQAYSHYRDIDLSSELSELIGLSNGNVFELELAEEVHASVV
jgi:hypothetical protein